MPLRETQENQLIPFQVRQMNKATHKSPFLVILITLAIALLLNIMPYPQWAKYAKPDWVLLVLFYWCLAMPHRIGVGGGWLSGMMMDILYYSLLGQHAVGKAFVALIAVSAYRKVRLYTLWQQCILVFIVASIDIGFTVWVYYVTADTEVRLVFWQSAFASCLIWPIIYNLLRFLRHKTGIR